MLVVSFGGPEGERDVMPFLANVLGNRPIPEAAKRRIAARYMRFGGISPHNGATRRFIEALEARLEEKGPMLPVYWGTRNGQPTLSAAAEAMQADGIGSALVYVTSLFSSYSGCRQYREDLHRAFGDLDEPIALHKLRAGYNHPGFIAAMADRLSTALDQAGPEATVLFTAHSLPIAMARGCQYEAQVRSASTLVAEAVGIRDYRIAYQSNNARSGVPWLEPTVGDALHAITLHGRTEVVVVPIGFDSDNMEVVYDLDIEAREQAESLGLRMTRADTVGTHPGYIGMVHDLVVERIEGRTDRPALGTLGPLPDSCPAGCCLSGRGGPVRPALCVGD